MTHKIERIKSGIPGLDEVIEGGFIKGHGILLCGSYGTGKSTFCLQYLVEGAKRGEAGLYITFEESPEQLKEEGEAHGWDIEKYEKEGKIKIVKVVPQDLLNLIEAGFGQIGDIIKSMDVKRIAVDSIMTFNMIGKSDYDRRKYVLDFVGWIKKHNCTAVMTMDTDPGEEVCTKFGIAESAADAILSLYNSKEKGARSRSLEVVKMRETNHGNKVMKFGIDKKGLKVSKK
jgi:KaiC/GvpD/RAD55 family RecA-like ATPase